MWNKRNLVLLALALVGVVLWVALRRGAPKDAPTAAPADANVVELSREAQQNAKIKVAQDQKIPYMLVVGGKDESAGTVSVRHRTQGDRGAVALEAFVADVTAERDERRLG